jgi:hypothetical protein
LNIELQLRNFYFACHTAQPYCFHIDAGDPTDYGLLGGLSREEKVQG